MDPESVELGVRETNLIRFKKGVVLPLEETKSVVGIRLQTGQHADLTQQERKEVDYHALCGGIADNQVDDILQAIKSPLEWEEDGRIWKQEISNAPATRQVVVHLAEQLEYLIKQKQARMDGLCQIRRELYTQCFDELIRQIAINSPERGLLLLRVRDEVQMTIAAFHSLHETGSAFGVKKADQYEDSKAEPEKILLDLRKQKADLEQTVRDLKAELQHNERSFIDKKQVDDKRHFEAMQFQRREHQLLKQHLDHISTPMGDD